MRLRLELRGNDGNAAGFVVPDEIVEASQCLVCGPGAVNERDRERSMM